MANSDAGTSSGSAGGGQYQVFLNFHGRDTRGGFTSFLYQDLTKNGIHAFMDDEELRVGEKIGEELPRAIDDSRIYIPIFSKNYADSKWCLRELARMVNNTTAKSKEKKIMPVFYDVEPYDVALKTPLYRTTIEKHKKEFPHEAESWEEALKKVDKIKGWVLPKFKNKAELVDLVVEKVLQELKIRYKSVTEDLVGLNDRVAEVLELLDVDCSDKARLLGIHGMGGIGKTTIAKVVYNKLSSHFGKCCAFLDDVRETSKNKEGLVSLQKMLLKDIDSSGAADTIYDVDHGKRTIEATLDSKKVLIVLDDVDEKKQIESLIGQHRLHPGTRVIITTRDTSVLDFTKQRMASKRKEMNSDHALLIQSYEMVAMNFDDALQLFKRHAFCEDSLATDFDGLSRDIVSTTGCLPLAVEVIGSSLCGQHKVKWENTLNILKKIPYEHVQEKLMISFDALNDHQREIFLDVACFFINEDITNAKYMWEACELYPELEIDVLVKKSLIKIKHDTFWMHNQLRDLGQEIVHRENPKNLGKRRRLWNTNEILDLVTEARYEDVEALDLRGVESCYDISFSLESFKSLRFLRLSHVRMPGDFIVSLPELRWISWQASYQHGSGPSMHSKKLVVLELSDNYFTDDSNVWDVIKMATNLKNLVLKQCHGITRTPDLSKCLALEKLTFYNCAELKEICRIPGTIIRLSRLSTLHLGGCEKITELPELPVSLVHLHVISHSLQVVPNLSKLTNLVELVLCDGYEDEDSSNLKHTCDLGWIGRLSTLKKLKLRLLNIAAPPTELGSLSLLEDLSLFGLDLQPLQQLPPSLRSLELDNFSSTGPPHSNLKIPPQVTLRYSRLQEIQLYGLSQLQDLYLEKCDLQSLSIPSSLRRLRVNGCHNMIEIQVLGMSASLKQLEIINCRSRIALCSEGGSLGVLDQSESSSSELTDCSSGVLLLSNALEKLELLLKCSENLLEIQVIGTLLSLRHIWIDECVAMEKLTGISNLKNLGSLFISRCSKLRVVEGLNKLEFLTHLSVDNCPSLETWLDISNSKISDECHITIYWREKSLLGIYTFKSYKEKMVQQGAPQSEINKEKAKMEGDAKEPNTELQLQFHPVASSQDHDIGKEPPIDNVKEGTLPGIQNQTRQQDANPLSISPLSSTELQLQFHPSASSRDHEINEEPPIDDVREGTPPGNQNQSREKDSNPQSNSLLSSTELQLRFHPSGSRDHEINGEPPIDDVREGTPPRNQNQTREQDSNPQSLDELARPRTFSDRFMTCLVSILECVCNRDFP